MIKCCNPNLALRGRHGLVHGIVGEAMKTQPYTLPSPLKYPKTPDHLLKYVTPFIPF